jgi:oxygen-independent coproporphyrinogen-3 oxidase
MERVMLEVRLQSGLEVSSLDPAGRHEVAGLIAEGLVDPAAAFKGRLVLTLKGRLLADAVVRRVLPD